MAAKDVEETQTEEQRENSGPMLDMSQAAVKKMIAQAKAKGYITYDELNAVLPQDQVSSEQIEDVMSLLSEMGVNVIEAEESADDSDDSGEETAKKSDSKEVATTAQETSTATLDRTDDPVRMYLREMGTVELLSREGEIAIAKRIEAGREKMIGGICESPLTIRALLMWSESLKEGRILLRDIIDLDATYGGGPNDDEIARVEAGEADEEELGEVKAEEPAEDEEEAAETKKAEPAPEPVVVKKGGHGGHHGGAWKVAYADFVTAMMAFFLLLWLLNATTEEQKMGISNYFDPTAISRSTRSGSGGVLGGTSITVPGALKSASSPPMISMPNVRSSSRSWPGASTRPTTSSIRRSPRASSPIMRSGGRCSARRSRSGR